MILYHLTISHVQRTAIIFFSCQEPETMASLADYLPPTLSNDTIRAFALSQRLPNPISIQSLNVTAEYHSIYVLFFNPDDAKAISPNLRPISPEGPVDLVL